MITKTILFTLLFFTSLYSLGQSGLISCNTQTNPDRTISIYANSQAYAEYTLKFSFTSLSGFTSRTMISSDIAIVPVNRGNAEVMKFTRENSFSNPSLQYKFQYFPGRVFHKMPDSSFEYLLPSSAGNHLRVTGNSATAPPLSQQLKFEYRGTAFAYKAGDTICASRAGIVFECSDTTKEGERIETAYKRGRNRVLVEHRDGTIGNYGITAPIKLLVSPGDEVFPGQPLAVFNAASEKYRVYFSICYLDEKRVMTGSGYDNTLYYICMPTVFYGNEDERSSVLQAGKEYTVQHPKNIIAAEMTRREKKKLGF